MLMLILKIYAPVTDIIGILPQCLLYDCIHLSLLNVSKSNQKHVSLMAYVLQMWIIRKYVQNHSDIRVI